jgi:hypothetical protein
VGPRQVELLPLEAPREALAEPEPQTQPEPEPQALPEPEPQAQPEPEPQALAEPDPEAPLLARKPDRAPDAPPAGVASLEVAPPPIQRPAPKPEPAPRDQAAAYALSQRNWADFEPEHEPEHEPDQEHEPEPDIRYPSLARAALSAEREAVASAALPSAPFDRQPAEIDEEATSPLEANWYAMQSEPEAVEPQAAPEQTWPTQERAWIEAEPALVAPVISEPAMAEPAMAEPALDEPAADPVQAAEAPAEARPSSVGSIAELMERLERGLARHRNGSSAPPSPAPAAAPIARTEPRSISPDPSDDRLQSAIESLQRFASRQD